VRERGALLRSGDGGVPDTKKGFFKKGVNNVGHQGCWTLRFLHARQNTARGGREKTLLLRRPLSQRVGFFIKLFPAKTLKQLAPGRNSLTTQTNLKPSDDTACRNIRGDEKKVESLYGRKSEGERKLLWSQQQTGEEEGRIVILNTIHRRHENIDFRLMRCREAGEKSQDRLEEKNFALSDFVVPDKDSYRGGSPYQWWGHEMFGKSEQ